MKGYKIFTQGAYGFEGNEVFYTTNYNTAIQKFNDFLRKVIDESDTVEKDDFGDIVQEFKDSNSVNIFDEKSELICRRCPFIIVKKHSKLTAIVYSWEKTSYEYEEWDITGEEVRIEEIEILT